MGSHVEVFCRKEMKTEKIVVSGCDVILLLQFVLIFSSTYSQPPTLTTEQLVGRKK